MVTAVSFALMLLTGLIPIGTYGIPALAGVLLFSVVIELGQGWSWAVYAAVSLLSGLVAGDKEAVLCYLLLFGCYPIVKAAIEKKTKKAVGILLKFAVFNTGAILEFFVAMYLLNVPKSSYTVFGIYMPWLILLIGNLVFAVYDYAVSLLIAVYCKKYHSYVSRWLHTR